MLENDTGFLNVIMEETQDGNKLMGIFWANLQEFWEEISQKENPGKDLRMKDKGSGFVLEVPKIEFGYRIGL